MGDLRQKIKTGLDEDRMLVLVVQVLIGFQFRGVFEPGFARLPMTAQYWKLIDCGLLLLALGLLLTVASCHRIIYKGEDDADFARLLREWMCWALLPFALALGIDIAVVSCKLFGAGLGLICGFLAAGAALFFWYGIETIACSNRKDGETMKKQSAETPLSDKIKQVLTEGRIVLPGAQALLGFQLSGFFTDSFEKLPRMYQILHLGALAFIALTAILLMTPPAYHRLVEKGEDTERFHKLANRFIIGAMIPLALGITLDFFIVLEKVTDSPVVSITSSALMLATFLGLWFAYPLARSSR